jgi:predicted DNA-binding transcriptional regulator AlpA
LEPTRPLATDDDFCAFAGLTKQQSAQLRYLGQGPRFIRVTGRQIRYAWPDIEEWCERRTVSRSDQRGAAPAFQANECAATSRKREVHQGITTRPKIRRGGNDAT